MVFRLPVEHTQSPLTFKLSTAAILENDGAFTPFYNNFLSFGD